MAAGVRMSLLKPLYRASIAFLICLTSAHAGEAYNAATLYIKGANQAEFDIIRVMFHNPSDSSFVHMYNDKNEKLCTGVLRSRGQNILLDDFSCNSGVLKFTNLEMHEVKKSSQMVMHVIGKIKNTNVTMPEATKQRILGEASFLRAFYYFQLARYYGGVPIITEDTNLNEFRNIESLLARI